MTRVAYLDYIIQNKNSRSCSNVNRGRKQTINRVCAGSPSTPKVYQTRSNSTHGRSTNRDALIKTHLKEYRDPSRPRPTIVDLIPKLFLILSLKNDGEDPKG